MVGGASEGGSVGEGVRSGPGTVRDESPDEESEAGVVPASGMAVSFSGSGDKRGSGEAVGSGEGVGVGVGVGQAGTTFSQVWRVGAIPPISSRYF